MKALKNIWKNFLFKIGIGRIKGIEVLEGQEALDWISEMIDENIKDGYIEVKDGKIINLK